MWDRKVFCKLAHILCLLFSLALAYAGSARQEISELLLPIVSDTSLSMELSGLAALALGMIFVGTCDGDISSTILQTMIEREENHLKDSWGRFMALGLALLFLGKFSTMIPWMLLFLIMMNLINRTTRCY